MSREKFDKHFCMVAIEKGFITSEQLNETLKIQVVEELESGKHRLRGQILQAKNYITLEQTDEVLMEMGLL